MVRVDGMGTRAAAVHPLDEADSEVGASLLGRLAEHDDALLEAYVTEEEVAPWRLRQRMIALSRRGQVSPLFFGSATGAGVDELLVGIEELLPAAPPADPAAPAGGRVFKVERGPSGEKLAYLRMTSGSLAVRERVHLHGGREGRVTRLEVFEPGGPVGRPSVVGGQIARVRGLDVQVGETVGAAPATTREHHFAQPTLETVVVPVHDEDRGALHSALVQLAEQDPLVKLRQDDVRQELYLSLYGEVQKEVIQATLEHDFGIAVAFRETTVICMERPTGTGAAEAILRARTHTNVTGDSSPTSPNPFLATLGLRVEAAPAGSGIELRSNIDVRLVPIYIYKTVHAFMDQMAGYVREALREGLNGWPVDDCTVTVTNCGYRAPGTTAADFRKLTPLMLMDALNEAGTVVCEPIHRFRLEAPADVLGSLLPLLAHLEAVPDAPSVVGSVAIIEGEVRTAAVHGLQRAVPGATRGEGVLECAFARYEPVRGKPPRRPRTDANPLDRKEYLLHVKRRV